jgi:hypothetical protein
MGVPAHVYHARLGPPNAKKGVWGTPLARAGRAKPAAPLRVGDGPATHGQDAHATMLIDDWGTNKTLCDIGPGAPERRVRGGAGVTARWTSRT